MKEIKTHSVETVRNVSQKSKVKIRSKIKRIKKNSRKSPEIQSKEMNEKLRTIVRRKFLICIKDLNHFFCLMSFAE